MRFTPDGPNIPDALVTAQERGQVLFVCGAGVSRGAGLPLFRRLVEGIYARLGESWMHYLAENEGMRDAGLLAGQYDRVLRCLERRLAAADVTRASGLRRRIRDAVRDELQPPSGVALTDHLTLLELSRDAEGVARLLTTNFDTLFERAWHDARGARIGSHAGPAMPRPGTGTFGGVLHLHGRLEDKALGLEDTDLVLTSAEFGEAYLRSGWASRYVYDLARTCTLVLVGYAADDPPMRYLLEVLEADRERYPDLRPVYAFAPTAEGEGKLQRALWDAKGIEPILYRISPTGGHGTLYETLREWRAYAADPSAWRERRLHALTAHKPADLASEQVEEAVALLRHGDATELLGKVSPDPAWMSLLAERSVLDGARTTAGSWIVTRLAEAEMVRACAEVLPRDCGSRWLLEHAVERERGQLPPHHAEAWRLIMKGAAQPLRDNPDHGWYAVAERVREGRIDAVVRSATAAIVCPRLRINRPWAWPSGTLDGEVRSIDQLVRVDFEPTGHTSSREILDAWPQDTDEESALLRVVDRALTEALEEAVDVGFARKGYDLVSQGVPAISSTDHDGSSSAFQPVTRLIADLWARIAAKDPGRARRLAAAWSDTPHLLLTRLHLHTLSDASAFPAAEVGALLVVLDDAVLWSGYAERELKPLLRARWTELPSVDRSGLEARLRAGLPRHLFPDSRATDEDWARINDHEIFAWLDPIRAAGSELDPATLDALNAIQARRPELLPGAGISGDVAPASQTFLGAQGDPEDLDGVADADLVAEALRRQQAHPVRQGELWQLICAREPERALRAVQLAADGPSGWQPDVVSSLLSAARESHNTELSAGVGQLLLDMPFWLLEQVGTAAAHWLLQRAGAPGGVDTKAFLGLWDRMAEIAYAPGGDDARAAAYQEPLDAALNEPGGLLAHALLQRLSLEPERVGPGLNARWIARLDRLVDASGAAGTLARFLLVQNLRFLDGRDAMWTRERLLPLLDWSHPEAAVHWRARALDDQPGVARLFDALKPGLIRVLRHSSPVEGRPNGLVTQLLQAAVQLRTLGGVRYDLSDPEVRAALADAVPGARRHAAWLLWRWVQGSKGEEEGGAARWREMVGPLFRAVWPLSAASRGPASSRDLVFMALASRDAFPDAVAAIVDVLVPFDLRHIATFIGTTMDYEALTAEHPRSLLRLLNAVIASKAETVPADLGGVLERCVRSDPAVVTDEPAYARLDGLRRLRSS